ncbi:hypothetical protein D1178_21575 [Stenotrophomonas maltophilia]|nr:hypothetical protein D1178_21575 [Stenotrophomonas maltophilia]
MVERNLAKVEVASSSLVSRSRFRKTLPQGGVFRLSWRWPRGSLQSGHDIFMGGVVSVPLGAIPTFASQSA